MNPRALLFTTLLLLATPSAAQSGLIVGTVRDLVTKEPVAGVVVTASSPDRQGVQVVVTDSSGVYQLPHLPSGRYDLSYAHEGYQSWYRGGVRVDSGRTRRSNVDLPPADFDGCFLGVPSPPSIDVDSTRTGVTLGQDFVRNVPLPSR